MNAFSQLITWVSSCMNIMNAALTPKKHRITSQFGLFFTSRGLCVSACTRSTHINLRKCFSFLVPRILFLNEKKVFFYVSLNMRCVYRKSYVICAFIFDSAALNYSCFQVPINTQSDFCCKEDSFRFCFPCPKI